MPKPVRSRMRSMPVSTVFGLPISAVPLSMRPSAVIRPPPERAAAADKILHRADRGVAGRHQHLERLPQKVVEQRLDRVPRLRPGALVGLGDIDRAGPAELLRCRLVAVLLAPARDRCCDSARRDRPRRTSRGTDICGRDATPRRPSRSTPATESRSADAGSDRAAASRLTYCRLKWSPWKANGPGSVQARTIRSCASWNRSCEKYGLVPEE